MIGKRTPPKKLKSDVIINNAKNLLYNFGFEREGQFFIKSGKLVIFSNTIGWCSGEKDINNLIRDIVNATNLDENEVKSALYEGTEDLED